MNTTQVGDSIASASPAPGSSPSLVTVAYLA